MAPMPRQHAINQLPPTCSDALGSCIVSRVNASPLHARLAIAAGDRAYRHLGELTGTHPETVRRYMQGAAPSVEFIAALIRALGLNSNWLLSGEGPMLARDLASATLDRASPSELLRRTATELESLGARLDQLEAYAAWLETKIPTPSGAPGGQADALAEPKPPAPDPDPA